MLTQAPNGPSPGLLVDPALLERAGCVHGFTERVLGTVSADRTVDERPDAIDRALVADPGPWRRREARQVHGASVWKPGSESVGSPEADALVTTGTEDLLIVRTADCLPVLLAAFDSQGRATAVAAIHAGWRGLVAGVLEATLDALHDLVGGKLDEADLVGALGPAIGPCCYEVGPEVARAVAERAGEGHVRPGEDDRSWADLPGAARSILEKAGVKLPSGPPPCTRCEPERFHSHRAAGDLAGRSGSFIGLRAR